MIAFLTSDIAEYLFMFVNYRKKYSALITRLNVGNYSQGYDIPRVVFHRYKVFINIEFFSYVANFQLHMQSSI